MNTVKEPSGLNISRNRTCENPCITAHILVYIGLKYVLQYLFLNILGLQRKTLWKIPLIFWLISLEGY